jgi:hypothetical protein
MRINFERLKFHLLDMAGGYEERKMLPQHAEAFQESRSYIPLHVIESTLKELQADGLISGTEIEDKSYLVTGITDDGIEELKSPRGHGSSIWD